MKNLFLCSYFAGVKDTFKDFMNNDTKGKKKFNWFYKK